MFENLAEEVVEEQERVEIKSYSRKKRGRKPLPSHLPVEEEIVDIAEKDKQCACGACKTVIGKETQGFC